MYGFVLGPCYVAHYVLSSFATILLSWLLDFIFFVVVLLETLVALRSVYLYHDAMGRFVDCDCGITTCHL